MAKKEYFVNNLVMKDGLHFKDRNLGVFETLEVFVSVGSSSSFPPVYG